MAYTIAIAGKGGTGKTTLAALIIHHLLKAHGRPVLAVDADPNANLNEALGVEYVRSVIDTIDRFMGGKEQLPAGVAKGRYLEYQIESALFESKGFDMLVMGRTEGPGCYCYANDLLRGLLDRLSDNYRYVVIDNEAGMEHLSRRTTRNVDTLLITAVPTVSALRSAARIHRTALELDLNIHKTFLVINEPNERPISTDEKAGMEEVDLTKINPAVHREISSLQGSGLPLLGIIPFDYNILERSIEAKGLMDLPDDSPVLETVARIVEKILA
ncbi:MAG TPA: carbon monoxide dehydrogenase [Candidatus Latescibacteria bacterium]|nr:carbon monoxide dehydrogenase [Candidatus Latescibacterota bacterium]